jgi:cellulose synthase/poly-beta-1,6-N-acetylglucosamine synthase-like glycosyltransferase
MSDRNSSAERQHVPRRSSANGHGLTVIVPAYNEEASIADTIRSLQEQTLKPKEILVVDDFSSDRTGEIARACGATVLRPPKNTGTKAGAQNFALGYVRTHLTMAIDADTTLAPDAIERLVAPFHDEKVAAASGFVIPRHVKTLWERGRYIEYLLAFTWYKPIQDYFDHPLISSGCFSTYRTEILKENGGWSTRTLAEDMDLTWSYYQMGYRVRFVPKAVCYPIEPHSFLFMRKQLRRWSHGFIQNVRLHWKEILETPFLRSFIMVALWDAMFASIAYLLLIPILALLFAAPLLLVGYVIDIPVVLVPVVFTAFRRSESWKAFWSVPAFFVLRTVNAFFILEAIVMELIFGRSLRTYEKGH